MVTQKQTTARTWTIALAAAVGAAMPLVGMSPAHAQVPVQQQNAMDANTRVGSGGRNEPAQRDTRATGNQIITGNVTGYKEFRGDIPYRDPRELRTDTGFEGADRFIRRSGGTANAENAGQIYSNEARPFYGQSRAVNPPPGFVSQGYGTGAFVPADVVASPRGLGDQPPPTQVQTRDAGVGSTIDRPNQTVMSAQGSQLIGTPQWQQTQLPGLANPRGFYAGDAELGEGGRLTDDGAIDRMRRELIDANGATRQQDTDEGSATPSVPQRGLDPATVAPVQPDIRAGVSAPASEVGTGALRQQTRQRMALPPEIQSAQYAELRERLADLERSAQTDEQAQRAFTQSQQMLQEAAVAPPVADVPIGAGPAQGQTRTAQPTIPSGADRSAPQPNQVQPAEPSPQQFIVPRGQGQPPPPPQPQSRQQSPPQSARPAPDPLEVRSLATGVPAGGLANLLTEAENDLRKGQYNTALEKYRTAEQVAPNNALITLGQAHAYLGAGYYARAASDLREALESDPVLLAGRYDVAGFLTQERLDAIVQELGEIAEREAQETTAPFLLAYIAYNTGDKAAANTHLATAQERAGGDDRLYRLMRRYWQLDPVESK